MSTASNKKKSFEKNDHSFLKRKLHRLPLATDVAIN